MRGLRWGRRELGGPARERDVGRSALKALALGALPLNFLPYELTVDYASLTETCAVSFDVNGQAAGSAQEGAALEAVVSSK